MILGAKPRKTTTKTSTSSLCLICVACIMLLLGLFQIFLPHALLRMIDPSTISKHQLVEDDSRIVTNPSLDTTNLQVHSLAKQLQYERQHRRRVYETATELLQNQIDENARVVDLLSNAKKQLMALQQEQRQPKMETHVKKTGTTEREDSGLNLVDVRRLDNTLGRLVVAVEEKEDHRKELFWLMGATLARHINLQASKAKDQNDKEGPGIESNVLHLGVLSKNRDTMTDHLLDLGYARSSSRSGNGGNGGGTYVQVVDATPSGTGPIAIDVKVFDTSADYMWWSAPPPSSFLLPTSAKKQLRYSYDKMNLIWIKVHHTLSPNELFHSLDDSYTANDPNTANNHQQQHWYVPIPARPQRVVDNVDGTSLLYGTHHRVARKSW